MSSSRVEELEVKHLKLTERFALICKENSTLTSEVVSLQNKITELTKAPFQKDSALEQIFDPEKVGWLKNGNAKNAKEQLQKLCDALQKEYVEYKTTHTRSDEEVDGLMKKLQSAQNKSAELADLLQEMEKRNGGGGRSSEDVKGLQRQLQEKNSEISRLQKDLESARSGLQTGRTGTGDANLKIAQGEIDALKKELGTLKAALATEEGLHKMKAHESEELSRRLDALRTQHREEVAALKQRSGEKGKTCEQCARYAKEVEGLQHRVNASIEEVARARQHITETSSINEKKYAALEAKLVETQSKLAQKTAALEHSVPQDEFEHLQIEKRALEHELSLLKARITHMDRMKNAEGSGKGGLDDDEILSVLAKNKDHISTLEFEKEELANQIRKLDAKIEELETKKSEEQQSKTEDKQRVAFLLKKCATLGAEVKKIRVERDHLSETSITLQAEAQRYQHQAAEIPELQKRIDSLTAEKQSLEDRLSATKEVEENLVKAKETIAYMELAQSRSISLTQYAEIQTQKQKLEHKIGPLQKQLEETQQEVARLREEKSSRAARESAEASVEDLQEEIEGLKENERILKEKLVHYKEENQRLATLNSSLDSQMSGMQNGIREMAMHMEKERSTAKEIAEKAAQKDVAKLREELEKAKSTIAGIQATEGQYVAEGLYLSAVEEKQVLLDQMQQKTVQLEKMKSEILIYRQTISELETENDEHVKDIEELQQKLEEERTAGEQKHVEAEKQLVDAHEELMTLRETILKNEEALAAYEIQIEELQAKSAKQQRAYEQKCQSEKQFSERLAALQSPEKTAGAAAAPTGVNATPPASSAGSKKKVKRIKKKKTLADQLSDDGDEDVLLAAASLPVASPAASSNMSVMAEPEKFHESSNQLERLQAENLSLKKTIDKLSKEVEQLQLSGDVTSGSSASEMTRLRKELREAIATTEKMKQQLDQAKAECKRTRALSNPGHVSEREKQLETELQHLQAELHAVADQLLPTKEKLSEYMAMADRIGIPYPFSEEYERRLARKMRSLKKQSVL